jgi:hypothetical protein
MRHFAVSQVAAGKDKLQRQKRNDDVVVVVVGTVSRGDPIPCWGQGAWSSASSNRW